LVFSESWENPSKITHPYTGGRTTKNHQVFVPHPHSAVRTADKAILSSSTYHDTLSRTILIPRGGGYLPGGWNPFGYAITDLGLEFLKFDGSLDSDIGRFLASLKSGRKKHNILRAQWVEIMRVSKSGQSMRILRTLDDLITFCLKAGFLD